jgi:ribose 5-phosphate isomerase B
MSVFQLAIGCDHAGYPLKEGLINHLQQKGHTIQDFGTNSLQSVDYPDFAHSVAEAVEQQKAQFGILICGSGNGINMAANKHQHIRAAVCWNKEVAELARQHNDANIISLPARFITNEEAKIAVDAFLNAVFEGGRHANRVNKIAASE